MSDHLKDYFINLSQREQEINTINTMISNSKEKKIEMEDYVNSLKIELEKINSLKEKSESKINNILESISKQDNVLELYEKDIKNLEEDDKKYINRIITNGVLEDLNMTDLEYILNKYLDIEKHNYYNDLFSPHIREHFKKLQIEKDGENIDKRQRKLSRGRKKSKKRKGSKKK